jgi:hypothetical protein
MNRIYIKKKPDDAWKIKDFIKMIDIIKDEFVIDI